MIFDWAQPGVTANAKDPKNKPKNDFNSMDDITGFNVPEQGAGSKKRTESREHGTKSWGRERMASGG